MIIWIGLIGIVNFDRLDTYDCCVIIRRCHRDVSVPVSLFLPQAPGILCPQNVFLFLGVFNSRDDRCLSSLHLREMLPPHNAQ